MGSGLAWGEHSEVLGSAFGPRSAAGSGTEDGPRAPELLGPWSTRSKTARDASRRGLTASVEAEDVGFEHTDGLHHQRFSTPSDDLCNLQCDSELRFESPPLARHLPNDVSQASPDLALIIQRCDQLPPRYPGRNRGDGQGERPGSLRGESVRRQFGHPDAQRPREVLDVNQRGIPLSSFDATEVGPV